jgi:hypothetical protein
MFCIYCQVVSSFSEYVKGKAVPLHAMEALGGEEI